MSTMTRPRTKAPAFRLVYYPPDGDRLAPHHRLNVFVRFYRKPTWTLAEAKRFDKFLDTSHGYSLDDYDPAYLEELGLPDLLDTLRQWLREYLAIEANPGFPTKRSIRNGELRAARLARNDRWWSRLVATYRERERCIRLAMPVRKTRTAQIKVEKQWIGGDPDIQRIMRIMGKLEKLDDRVRSRAYYRREREGQRPDEPFRVRR